MVMRVVGMKVMNLHICMDTCLLNMCIDAVGVGVHNRRTIKWVLRWQYNLSKFILKCDIYIVQVWDFTSTKDWLVHSHWIKKGQRCFIEQIAHNIRSIELRSHCVQLDVKNLYDWQPMARSSCLNCATIYSYENSGKLQFVDSQTT